MSKDQNFYQGRREHNLKNIDLTIRATSWWCSPGFQARAKARWRSIRFTPTASAAMSKSLSSYARQFLGQMEKPNVVQHRRGFRRHFDRPEIHVEQPALHGGHRHRNLRLSAPALPRIGIPHCPVCGREISQQTVDQMVDRVLALPEKTKIQVMAPVIRGRKGTHQQELDAARRSGYVRIRADGHMYDLSENIALEKNKKHTLEVVIDRLVVSPAIRSRLAGSIETALSLTGSLVLIDVVDGEELLFSQSYSCPEHDISLDDLAPRMFSFNSPFGACEKCTGLGTFMKVDPDLVVPNKNLSVREGAIKASGW